jgi:Putative Ig domain
MNFKVSLIAAIGMVVSATAAMADTYTYKYVGPAFSAGTDHIEISFTTSAPLAPSASYLSTTQAGVISGSINVVGPNGSVNGFPISLNTFQLLTNAQASATTPGIVAWDLLGDQNTLTGLAPTMTGVDYQAYSINTLAGIPGANVPGAVGLVTGAYDYEQATIVAFYSSCAGVSGCALAGNGQPYASQYGGIINPSNTSASAWTLTVNTTVPNPSPLALTGNLTDGTTGVAYVAALTATGGTTAYTWSATGLPTGVSINPGTGAITGTPTAAGSFPATVTVKDATAKTASVSATVVISTPATTSYPCTPPAGAKRFQFAGTLKKVGAGYIVVGKRVTQTPTCAKIQWNGANGFAPGEIIEASGYWVGSVAVATSIIVN